jgi:hypothetical protein
MMRYLGYALAIVIGVAALISGITSGGGVLAGAAVGWLIASVINIVTSQSARVEGQDDAIFALFDVPWYIWLIDVGLLVVGGLIGFFIKH